MPEEKADKTCFVIAPIGKDGSGVRKRSDDLYSLIIKPACNECGYDVTRADMLPEAGSITSQVTERLQNSSIVIADLTGANPNVFYELGARDIFNKPVIQMMQFGEELPFDIRQQRTIHYRYPDWDTIGDTKKKLVGEIQAIDKDPSKSDSPFSSAITLESLKQSPVSPVRLLAQMDSTVEDIHRKLDGIQRMLDVAQTREPSTKTYLGAMPADRVDARIVAGDLVAEGKTREAQTNLVDLSFSVIPKQPKTGQTFRAIVRMESRMQPVSGIDLCLDFDPQYLSAAAILGGSALPLTLASVVDNEHGHITFSAAKLGGPFPSGSFPLLTIEFMAKAETIGTRLGFSKTLPRMTLVAYAGLDVTGALGDAVIAIH